MQFIKTCFRGGLREHWLEMLIIISDNVLTCLLPYPAASGAGGSAGRDIGVLQPCLPAPAPAPPLLCRAGSITAGTRRRNFLPVEEQLVGGEGKGKQAFFFCLFFFILLFFFFFGAGSFLAGKRE